MKRGKEGRREEGRERGGERRGGNENSEEWTFIWLPQGVRWVILQLQNILQSIQTYECSKKKK